MVGRVFVGGYLSANIVFTTGIEYGEEHDAP
jgi:hypothetical protein